MIKSIGFCRFGLVIIPKIKTFQTAKKPNQMKKSILLIFLSSIITISVFSQVTVIKSEGNPEIKKQAFIKNWVNVGSTIKKENIIINDAECPIQLNNVTVVTEYSPSSSGSYYGFKPIGSIVTNQPIVAYEVFHIIYDVFGDYVTTLSNLEVTDIDGQKNFSEDLGWLTSKINLRTYFSCVSYVANVRTKSGIVWHYNFSAIKEQLDILKISFEEGYIPKYDTYKQN